MLDRRIIPMGGSAPRRFTGDRMMRMTGLRVKTAIIGPRRVYGEISAMPAGYSDSDCPIDQELIGK